MAFLRKAKLVQPPTETCSPQPIIPEAPNDASRFPFQPTISRKRRSCSAESCNEGKAFIVPENRSKGKNHQRTFFRVSSPQENQTYFANSNNMTNFQPLANFINGLSASQTFHVCLALQVRPPNKNALLSYVAAISPSNAEMRSIVQDAIQNVLRPIKPGSGPFGPQSGNLTDNFFDCRYSLPCLPAPTIHEPVQLGGIPVDFSFPLPSCPPGLHIVIQSFVMNTNFQNSPWPHTLRITANGINVKTHGLYRFPVIDLTCFPPGTLIRVACSIEASKYLLLIRFASFSDYSAIVLKLQSEAQPQEFINQDEISLLSPISGKIMKHPGRGKNCQHSQCFDLKEYLKLSSMTQRWNCPICNDPLAPNSLMYSHATKKLLYVVQSQAIQQVSQELSQQESPVNTQAPLIDPSLNSNTQNQQNLHQNFGNIQGPSFNIHNDQNSQAPLENGEFGSEGSNVAILDTETNQDIIWDSDGTGDPFF